MSAVKFNRSTPNIDWNVCVHSCVSAQVSACVFEPSVAIDGSVYEPFQASRPLGYLTDTRVHTNAKIHRTAHTHTDTHTRLAPCSAFRAITVKQLLARQEKWW